MTWYPDLGQATMVASGDRVRAVGWLHPNHDYSRGAVPAAFVEKLKAFSREAASSTEALGFILFMGVHTCEFCDAAHGAWNFGVPSGEILYIAPEMISHYVERHEYAPPEEFISAVLASPLPASDEYRAAVEPFRASFVIEQTICMSPDEQRAFWSAINAPPNLTPAQKRLGELMRGK